MEQRIDRIEKAIEKMVRSQEVAFTRHDKIIANLEANQIVMAKMIESNSEDTKKLKLEVSRFISVVSDFMDAVGYKLKEHDNKINKLEEKN